ncbi:MAG: orotate phosphoribosyltransferase [Vampirovibrionales bacterium]|nr:orotate phosphoribosyltransferase [Vampirovibrionales bacterium]
MLSSALLQTQRDELFELLKRLAFRRGDFILASGKRASFYLDCRLVTLHGRGAHLIGQLLYEQLEPLHLDAVGGVVLGAAPMVSAITARSAQAGNPMHGFLIRKQGKGHGADRLVEGPIDPWMRVAIVEDVITTGRSVLQGIETLRRSLPDIKITGVYALIDRGDGGREAIEAESIPCQALYSVDEFLRG